MWDLYGAGLQAVAIQTTYVKLINYFPKEIIAGTVSYIDYTRDSFPRVRHLRRTLTNENLSNTSAKCVLFISPIVARRAWRSVNTEPPYYLTLTT